MHRANIRDAARSVKPVEKNCAAGPPRARHRAAPRGGLARLRVRLLRDAFIIQKRTHLHARRGGPQAGGLIGGSKAEAQGSKWWCASHATVLHGCAMKMARAVTVAARMSM